MRRSLAARLMIAAAVWSLIVLVAAGWGLTQLYQQSVMRGLEQELEVVLDGLMAEVETEQNTINLKQTPNDPRFSRAFSGRYWEVVSVTPGTPPKAGRPLRSRSLWDEELPLDDELVRVLASPGRTVIMNGEGPSEQPLRMAGVLVKLGDSQVALFAAADRRPAERDAQRFSFTLFAALAVLGAGIVAAVFFQVRIGLSPLNRVRADVADVRRGKTARLEGEYPTEVAPLTEELNKLLDHNREVVERARTHVGNLAHALKTPISVLLNEARSEKGPLAELVSRQAEGMARNVEHYLQRAQAAARAEVLGARTPAKPVLEDIARTLEQLYGRKKDMDIELDAPHDATFRGERQDLEEMAGNLAENACKYGAGKVRIRLIAPERAGTLLRISIEDDGPGLSPEQQEFALKRGARLDESAPGQGLGMSITAELARAYGGRLSFSRSDLGGLRAELTLPTVD